MDDRIYLDNNATTLLDRKVAKAIEEEMAQGVGNPSSVHSFGRAARARLAKARASVAAYFQVRPDEIVFTSGATESAALFLAPFTGHIISSAFEHACVHDLVLKRAHTLLSSKSGRIEAAQVVGAIRDDTCLIAMMAANNETGVKNDIAGIADIAKKRGIPLFVDGVALLGKEEIVIAEGVSAMSFSGHKAHAPAGVGCLFVRKNFAPSSQFVGPQKRGLRSGTENLTGIVGFAKALALLEEELPQATERMRLLRDVFEQKLQLYEGVSINGTAERVCNTSNLMFQGRDGEALFIALDSAGIAASMGSACSSGALEPSRPLLAMGLTPLDARSSLRFSLSRLTTEKEIEKAVSIIGRHLV